MVRTSSNYTAVSEKLEIWLQRRREVAKKIWRDRGVTQKIRVNIAKEFPRRYKNVTTNIVYPFYMKYSHSVPTNVSILTNEPYYEYQKSFVPTLDTFSLALYAFLYLQTSAILPP